MAVATAGHDTTASTISGAAYELARRPDQLAMVRADPAAGRGERVLGIAGQALHARRAVTRARPAIKAGDQFMLLYASANRDVDVFDHPDWFDVERDVRHVAFGTRTPDPAGRQPRFRVASTRYSQSIAVLPAARWCRSARSARSRSSAATRTGPRRCHGRPRWPVRNVP